MQRGTTLAYAAWEAHDPETPLGLAWASRRRDDVVVHFVGVHDDGYDVIPNGLALCPTHHAAYDRGLLLVLSDGRIRLNKRRLDALQASDVEVARLRRNLRLVRGRNRTEPELPGSLRGMSAFDPKRPFAKS